MEHKVLLCKNIEVEEGVIKSQLHSIKTNEINLGFFYKHLECDTIDIPYVSKSLCKRGIDVVIDDEGKFTDKTPTAVIVNGTEVIDLLVGNIMFVSHDDEGRSIGLSEQQEIYVRALNRATINYKGNEYSVLVIKL